MIRTLPSANHAITKVCALGAGTMGVGTAMAFACVGSETSLYARNAKKLDIAYQTISPILYELADYELVERSEIPAILARIKPTTDLAEAARGSKLFMESIAEEMPVKQDMFLRLDKIADQDAYFATNTSALDPTEIASVLSPARREKFVVMHGFNRPELMPCVEVVPGKETSIETMLVAMQILEIIGKKPVRLHRAAPGFVGNKNQAAIIWAALELHVQRGISATEIDADFRRDLGVHYQTIGPLGMAGIENGTLSHVEAQAYLAQLNEKPITNSISKYIERAALRAAVEIVANGTASVAEVEEIFIASLGRRYVETGPLESADMGGLDIFESIFKTLGYLHPDTTIGQYDDETKQWKGRNISPNETPVGRFITSKVTARETGTKSESRTGIYVWSPERIAEVGKRRKITLIKFLQADAAARRHRWVGSNVTAGRPFDGRRTRFPEHRFTPI